jgi:hypothetical protein
MIVRIIRVGSNSIANHQVYRLSKLTRTFPPVVVVDVATRLLLSRTRMADAGVVLGIIGCGCYTAEES